MLRSHGRLHSFGGLQLTLRRTLFTPATIAATTITSATTRFIAAATRQRLTRQHKTTIPTDDLNRSRRSWRNKSHIRRRSFSNRSFRRTIFSTPILRKRFARQNKRLNLRLRARKLTLRTATARTVPPATISTVIAPTAITATAVSTVIPRPAVFTRTIFTPRLYRRRRYFRQNFLRLRFLWSIRAISPPAATATTSTPPPASIRPGSAFTNIARIRIQRLGLYRIICHNPRLIVIAGTSFLRASLTTTRTSIP